MRQNFWTLTSNRVSLMCKRYNITAELTKGSRYNGISWSVTFWCGPYYVAELSAMTARELFEKVAAFDYGMATVAELKYIRSEPRSASPYGVEKMRLYSVCYRHDYDSVFDSPYVFVCSAETEEHAIEQCRNAYEHCEILKVIAESPEEE